VGNKKDYRIFTAIFLATFFVMFGDSMSQSFKPLFIAGLGASPAVIALIYNIKNVIQTLLRLVAGTLSDTLGHRNLMLLGLTLFAVVPLLYSVATEPWVLVLAMVANGLAASIYFPPSEAYASSLFPPEKAGEAMGKYHMSWAISSFIGPSVGGLLASIFPVYRQLFVIAGVITSISLAITWMYIEDDRDISCSLLPTEQLKQLLQGFPSTMTRMMSNRKILVASISVFAHAFCHWGLVAFIPMLGTMMGMSEFLIGVTLTANALIIVVGLPIIGPLSDRVGRFPPIAAGLLISVVAFAAMPLAPYHWVLPVLNGVLGLSAVLVFPVSQAATMEEMPLKDRGTATGVWGMVMSLGGTLGMFAMSGILVFYSVDVVFYAYAIFTLVAALVVIAMKGYFT
jgi:MFS family permease